MAEFIHGIRFAAVLGVLLAAAGVAPAQNPPVHVSGEIIEGPLFPREFPAWIAGMQRWRMEQLKRMGYDDSEYARPELKWTEGSYMQPQMMIQDRYFYDPKSGKYTVDRYLDDLDKRFGGIDAVLIWPTYPNMGIDNRNQFDLFHDMPGGIDGIRQMVADFHRRGVRVLFPVMLWDQGTRDVGKLEASALAEELTAVGADGVNGDTMIAMPRQFRAESDKTGHPLAFEPEHLTEDEALAYNNMNWAQAVPALCSPCTGQPAQATPSMFPSRLGAYEPEYVDKYKWLEPRHMVNISDRWQRDKTFDLQYAWFNGVGMETWENIWGIWNGLTERDAETIRRIGKVERKFSSLLVSPEWVPDAPTLQYQVYASRWPGKERTLWTLIDKNEFDISGEQMVVPYKAGRRYFDLWHGVELKPEVRGDRATLSFTMEAYGFGALLAIDGGADVGDLPVFLEQMRDLNKVRLDSFSNQWHVLPQAQVTIAPTKLATAAPPGMVPIPGGDFIFKVSGIEIEGGDLAGVDVQYPWEDAPRRDHVHRMQIASFYIDSDPVTNAAFKQFLDAKHYHPKDDHNFLRDWKDGTYPDGWGNKPVTWVSLEDARAFASWAGKRLPHEWEWQYAAEGSDGRNYPWGNVWQPDAAPIPDRDRDLRAPDDVTEHPQGKSVFGVEDMVGNVWQWTDEYQDDHTRAAVLRGGSYYRPQGSKWYFPQPYDLHEHGKFLLMSPSEDRSGTVGFRCVVDAKPAS
jgi:formylglycine-generating enzyme required for sulfatase activity